jgi:tetratricopeptide (TPR) repeat protein
MTRRIFLSCLIVVLFLFSLTTFVKFYKADVNYKKSQNFLKDGSYDNALKRASLAISANPLIPRYYQGRAKILLTYLSQAEESEKPEIKELVLQDLQRAYNLNPDNLVTARNIVPLYYFLAARDLTLPGSADNVDRHYIEVTQEFYRVIRGKYPDDVGVSVLLAKYEQRLGLEEDFNIDMARVKELRPDLLEWYFIP